MISDTRYQWLVLIHTIIFQALLLSDFSSCYRLLKKASTKVSYPPWVQARFLTTWINALFRVFLRLCFRCVFLFVIQVHLTKPDRKSDDEDGSDGYREVPIDHEMATNYLVLIPIEDRDGKYLLIRLSVFMWATKGAWEGSKKISPQWMPPARRELWAQQWPSTLCYHA
jgi:hypothetical protein